MFGQSQFWWRRLSYQPAAVLIASVVFCCLASSLPAADWPMWRHDSARTAVSPDSLPADLHLQWVREFPPLKPAFHSARLQFDLGYEPVILGKLIFLGSSRNDAVTAFDLDSGAERWQFFADGPVRFAPVAWKSFVYFGSDDGHLYCLNARDGTLRWKFRAAPSSRKLLGNERLISVWPVRGGPVPADGKIYFAAGVWPMEGVFVYALDAESGQVIWLNDRAGYLYGQHPHAAEAFGGLSPQGYLVINGDELIVPCGSAMPARFDRQTGKLIAFELPKPGRLPGGWFAAVDPETAKDRRRGKIAYDSEISREKHEDKVQQSEGIPGLQSTVTLGDRKLSFKDGFTNVAGTVHTMLAADGKLLVVTREGGLYCFARKMASPKRHPKADTVLSRPSDGWREKAAGVLDTTGARHGYALVLGLGSGRLAEELAAQSDLRIIAVDPDAAKVSVWRKRLDAAGLYGTRIAVHAGDPLDFGFPPYCASLVVSEDLAAAGFKPGTSFVARVFAALRPFGGVACLGLSSANRGEFQRAVKQARLESAEVRTAGELTLLTRVGALAGAVNYTGDWTSPDPLVKAPLGVLWFDDALGHFKRSPQPKFIDGIMVSQPKDWNSGLKRPYPLLPTVFSDVYTGRVLSEPEATPLRKRFPNPDPAVPTLLQYRPHGFTGDPYKPIMPSPGERINPLTGATEPRTFPRSYGCDGGIDYGYLYTMRSGTAAFYDKRNESGIINISGPRSGCSNSVIPANGVLNVPFFYEGCTCSYPLPVGLALVNMPEEYEQWTAWGPGPTNNVQRVGINLGAPGDRMTDDGTLWLDHPSVGGPSPALVVRTEPANPPSFYRHSLWVEGGRGWPWVAASGVEGLKTLTLEGLKTSPFTVRLHFLEPRETSAGRRVFHVSLQGKQVLSKLDIVGEAGGRMRSLVKELQAVPVDGALTVALTPVAGETILCGVEVIAEGLKPGPVPTLAERRVTAGLVR